MTRSSPPHPSASPPASPQGGEAKKLARARARAAVAALSADERRARGDRATLRLLALRELRVASDVLLFRSLADEIDTAPIFAETARAGQRTYAPRVVGDRLEFVAVDLASDWSRGAYKTLEPKSGPTLDYRDLASGLPVIIVPGLAFTARGDRLGRGGGPLRPRARRDPRGRAHHRRRARARSTARPRAARRAARSAPRRGRHRRRDVSRPDRGLIAAVTTARSEGASTPTCRGSGALPPSSRPSARCPRPR